MKTMLCAGLIACAAGSAVAQPDVLGTWLWDVTTQDGDAVVEPGETATFTLSMDFSPDVGQKGLTGLPIQGLAYLEFDTLGMQNAEMGTIVGWEILNDLDFAFGDVTTTDGTSLFGTVAAYPIPWKVLSHDDPIDVIRVDWMPLQYAEFSVSYQTATNQLSVWEGESLFDLQGVEWPAQDATISFEVVPAPPVLLSLAAVGFRRCRRRTLRTQREWGAR